MDDGSFGFGIFVGFVVTAIVAMFIVTTQESQIKLYPYDDQTCVVQYQEILRCYPTGGE